MLTAAKRPLRGGASTFRRPCFELRFPTTTGVDFVPRNQVDMFILNLSSCACSFWHFRRCLLSNPAPTQGPLESRHDRQRPKEKTVPFSREHFERLSRWFAFRVLSYRRLCLCARLQLATRINSPGRRRTVREVQSPMLSFASCSQVLQNAGKYTNGHVMALTSRLQASDWLAQNDFFLLLLSG